MTLTTINNLTKTQKQKQSKETTRTGTELQKWRSYGRVNSRGVGGGERGKGSENK